MSNERCSQEHIGDRIPWFLAGVLAWGAVASADPPMRRWTIDRDSLSPAPAETRTMPRTVEEMGLRLSGRGTPFVVAPRIDALDTPLPTDAITVEAWVAIDEPRQWGGVIGAIQDNGDAETGFVLGYGDTAPYFALASVGIDDADGRLTYLTAERAWVPGKWLFFFLK